MRGGAQFVGCEMTDTGFRVLLPETLLENRPLSAAGLVDEAKEWKSIGLRLEVKPLRDAAVKAAYEVLAETVVERASSFAPCGLLAAG